LKNSGRKVKAPFAESVPKTPRIYPWTPKVSAGKVGWREAEVGLGPEDKTRVFLCTAAAIRSSSILNLNPGSSATGLAWQNT